MNTEIRNVPTSPSINEVVSQWNAAHGSAYSIRESDVNWNFEKQGLVSYWLTNIEKTPVILAKATLEGVRAGLAEKNVWLSLWGRIHDEEKFLQSLHQVKTSLRKSKLVIGGDEFHLVPGIPLSEAGMKLQSACKAANFEGAESADYSGNLRNQEITNYIEAAVEEAKKRGLTFKDVTAPTDFSTLENFLATEFPGRWTREFQFWKSREDTQRAFWKLLRTAEDEVIGFARMALRDRMTPANRHWTPGALRISEADCCLGPIGVASSQRGRGTGKVLLGLVLECLRNSPSKQICIDWTNAFKYYEPLNLGLVRRYWTAWMSDPS